MHKRIRVHAQILVYIHPIFKPESLEDKNLRHGVLLFFDWEGTVPGQQERGKMEVSRKWCKTLQTHFTELASICKNTQRVIQLVAQSVTLGISSQLWIDNEWEKEKIKQQIVQLSLDFFLSSQHFPVGEKKNPFNLYYLCSVPSLVAQEVRWHALWWVPYSVGKWWQKHKVRSCGVLFWLCRDIQGREPSLTRQTSSTPLVAKSHEAKLCSVAAKAGMCLKVWEIMALRECEEVHEMCSIFSKHYRTYLLHCFFLIFLMLSIRI